MNRFLFVFSRWCKNSTPVYPLAYKSTAAVASALFTGHTATALLTVAKFMQTRLFPSFPAFCCIHFLTFISNSVTISQRAKTARKPENLHPSVSVVSGASSVCECKVINY